MEGFLRLDSFGNQNQRACRKQPVQERSKKALSATAYAVNRQCAATLQALNQGLNSGSCRGKVEKRLPSRTCGTLYQLNKTLQAKARASSGVDLAIRLACPAIRYKRIASATVSAKVRA